MTRRKCDECRFSRPVTFDCPFGPSRIAMIHHYFTMFDTPPSPDWYSTGLGYHCDVKFPQSFICWLVEHSQLTINFKFNETSN